MTENEWCRSKKKFWEVKSLEPTFLPIRQARPVTELSTNKQLSLFKKKEAREGQSLETK